MGVAAAAEAVVSLTVSRYFVNSAVISASGGRAAASSPNPHSSVTEKQLHDMAVRLGCEGCREQDSYHTKGLLTVVATESK